MNHPPTTMKALVLHGVGDLRYETVPRPAIRPGQILIRVGFCGVCGSDIPRIFVKGTYHFPTICGHEFAGTVEECGAETQGFSPGDRVVVFPLLWCGRCAACEQGKYVQCYDYNYLGSRSDGGFAQYVAAPPRNLVRVPDGVTLEEAAMTEPAAVALHALRRVGGCSIGDCAVIFGAGPIGLMAAQWARAMGASRIALFDIVEEKLAMARQYGFTRVFDSRQNDPVKTVESLTGGEGAHVCVEAAGVPAATVQALTCARRGGRVVLLGNPSGDVTLPAGLISQLLRREVNVFGTWNSDYSAAGNDDDWRRALAAMANKTLNLLPLVTHKVELENAPSALLMMKDQKEFYSKVLIYPNPDEPEPKSKTDTKSWTAARNTEKPHE